MERLLLTTLILAGLVSSLPAQKFEIHPYAGGFFSNTRDIDGQPQRFKQQGIYGAKAGYFLTRNFEVEGNFGYINQFEFEGTDPKSRGLCGKRRALTMFPGHPFALTSLREWGA